MQKPALAGQKNIFEQFASEKLSSTMLQTNHQPYSCEQTYPQLQVISHHLSAVHCLLRPCLMVIKQNICEENKFQIQSISKATVTKCVKQSSVFKSSDLDKSCTTSVFKLIQVEQLESEINLARKNHFKQANEDNQ